MTWMQTASGKSFDFLDLESNEVDIKDIAAHLSKTCRYAGAVQGLPYSVAQHCVLVSQQVVSYYQFPALMHDAAEAYTGDVTRPLKQVLGPAFKELEQRIEQLLARRFGFQYPFPEAVKEVDRRLLATEARDLMAPSARVWESLDGVKPFAFPIRAWGWEIAQEQFLQRFQQLYQPKK